MAVRPVTDDDRQAVADLHARGLSRNDIARQLGRSGRTVSRIADALGLSFDRDATRAATDARQADLAARRARLALDLQDDAERLRRQLWEPHTYFDWGGKDHDFAQHTAPQPTAGDKRALLGAVGIAVDRSLKLEPPKDDTGAGEIGSLLGGLFDRLREQHGDA